MELRNACAWCGTSRPLILALAILAACTLVMGCPTETADDDTSADDDGADDDGADDDGADDDSGDDDTGDDDTTDPCEDHCSNGIFDCAETDTDCGGECDACDPLELFATPEAAFVTVAATDTKVVVAWCYDGVRYVCRDASGWSAVQELDVGASYTKSTRVQADSQGRIHLVVTKGGGNSILYSLFDGSDDCAGSSWSAPQPLVEIAQGGGRYAQVAVDENDDPHVVWHDQDYTNVYYRHATAGAWDDPVEHVTDTQWDSRFPDLTVIGTTAHVFFEQDDASYMNCHPSYTYDTGNGFAAAVDLVDAYHSWPQIVADDAGDLHALYTRRHGDCEVKYRRFTGGSWEPEVVISTAPSNWTISSLATDAAGDTLHAVWHQLVGGNGQVHYAVADASTGTWETPRQVAVDDTMVNWLATLAVDPAGHTHIVWLKMQPDPIHEDSGAVWYRKVTLEDL